MPYIKKTIQAGKTIEVRKYYSTRFGVTGVKRAPKFRPTPEEQRRVNERQAADTLTWRLNENFGFGDIHLVLSYAGPAPSREEARHRLEKFIRTARRYFRQQGKEMRYIAVTEYKNRRIHHHLVMENVPIKDLYTMWPHGRPKVFPLDDSGDYRELAEYLIKETAKTFAEEGSPYKKRWNQSKNLRAPKIKTEVVSASAWSRQPRAKKGYYIPPDTIREGVHKENGFPYQYYTMIEIDRRC